MVVDLGMLVSSYQFLTKYDVSCNIKVLYESEVIVTSPVRASNLKSLDLVGLVTSPFILFFYVLLNREEATKPNLT